MGQKLSSMKNLDINFKKKRVQCVIFKITEEICIYQKLHGMSVKFTLNFNECIRFLRFRNYSESVQLSTQTKGNRVDYAVSVLTIIFL